MSKVYMFIVGAIGFVCVSMSVYALSFTADTIFIQADTEDACVDAGGQFTEWYEEKYCTVAAQELLTDVEQEKVREVAEQIIALLDHDFDLYEYLIEKIGDYENKFRDAYMHKKEALAFVLLYEIQQRVVVSLATCTAWYDNCDLCRRGEDDVLSCTRKHCFSRKVLPHCVPEDGFLMGEEGDALQVIDDRYVVY